MCAICGCQVRCVGDFSNYLIYKSRTITFSSFFFHRRFSISSWIYLFNKLLNFYSPRNTTVSYRQSSIDFKVQLKLNSITNAAALREYLIFLWQFLLFSCVELIDNTMLIETTAYCDNWLSVLGDVFSRYLALPAQSAIINQNNLNHFEDLFAYNFHVQFNS